MRKTCKARQAAQKTDQASFHSQVPTEEFKLLNTIVNNIGDELMMIDKNGNIVCVNDATVKGLGYTRKQLLERNIVEFHRDHPSPLKWKTTYFNKIKKSKGPISYQIERIVRNGKIQTIEITAAYMFYHGKGYILSVGRDITDRLALERRQKDYDKMAALSHFVSGTVQEIKYPLDAVYGHVREILRKYEYCDFEYISYKAVREIMSAMRDISTQIQHCCDITDKLLKINKRRAGVRTSYCDVNGVIRESLGGIGSQLKELGIKVTLKLAKKIPLALISYGEFRKIVSNIISNAIDAMPSGGKLLIQTSFEKNERKICVSFKDNGVGISKENLSRVFDPFFTTRLTATGHNVGLGLSVVHSIVRNVRGEVNIQSSLRKGTLTRVFIPAKKNWK